MAVLNRICVAALAVALSGTGGGRVEAIPQSSIGHDAAVGGADGAHDNGAGNDTAVPRPVRADPPASDKHASGSSCTQSVHLKDYFGVESNCLRLPPITANMVPTSFKYPDTNATTTAAGIVNIYNSFINGTCVAHISGSIGGLPPNTPHALHIHEFGDISSMDGKSAGGHYAPYGNEHGKPGTEPSHLGDVANIKAASDGVAEFHVMSHRIFTLQVIGRGVVLHEKYDNGVDSPGGRVACGVLGHANPAFMEEHM